MNPDSKKKLHISDGLTEFFCPGCLHRHTIRVGEGYGPHWVWNGDMDKPTFTPSILITGRKFTPKGRADYEAWYAAGCQKNEDGSLHKFENAESCCHSFITDGQIQFRSDCTHELAGQTVPLPCLSESE
jgi:hypothetical protein